MMGGSEMAGVDDPGRVPWGRLLHMPLVTRFVKWFIQYLTIQKNSIANRS